MFIQTEGTPNPATLKFLPGCEVMPRGTANFPDVGDAARSPMASALFGIEGVEGVFLGGDFISITKADGKEWDTMKPRLLATIMEHFQTGQPIIKEGEVDETASGEEDSETVAQIKELIETRVRPAVAQDGGDIIFKGFENGIVLLKMQGACSGCPSSTMTLKHGIENMLKYYVPEVQEVQAVE